MMATRPWFGGGILLDDFGQQLGRVYRETDEAAALRIIGREQSVHIRDLCVPSMCHPCAVEHPTLLVTH
jgi:hypothetical protein